jgi:hypothetical protein
VYVSLRDSRSRGEGYILVLEGRGTGNEEGEQWKEGRKEVGKKEFTKLIRKLNTLRKWCKEIVLKK